MLNAPVGSLCLGTEGSRRGGVIYAEIGCHAACWFCAVHRVSRARLAASRDSSIHEKRRQGKERCTGLHRGNFLRWPSVLWPNDAKAIQPSLNLRLDCHGAMPRAVSSRYNPNGEAWKSLGANGPPSMPPWMNGPLFLANVNDLYICPLAHPGLIFHIPACETQRVFVSLRSRLCSDLPLQARC